MMHGQKSIKKGKGVHTQAMKAYRSRLVIAPLTLNLDTRWK